jgi:uncharacterized membrane protein (UPF0127 family)
MKHHLADAIVCSSAWSKARGLMFSPKRTLVFAFDADAHVPLHMWFVFFPIDVAYLDADRNVIELKKDFKPFAFYTPQHKARYVIEIPKRTELKIGDTMSWNGDARI